MLATHFRQSDQTETRRFRVLYNELSKGNIFQNLAFLIIYFQIDGAVREEMSKNALKLGNSAMLEKKAKVILQIYPPITIIQLLKIIFS